MSNAIVNTVLAFVLYLYLLYYTIDKQRDINTHTRLLKVVYSRCEDL